MSATSGVATRSATAGRWPRPGSSRSVAGQPSISSFAARVRQRATAAQPLVGAKPEAIPTAEKNSSPAQASLFFLLLVLPSVFLPVRAYVFGHDDVVAGLHRLKRLRLTTQRQNLETPPLTQNIDIHLHLDAHFRSIPFQPPLRLPLFFTPPSPETKLYSRRTAEPADPRDRRRSAIHCVPFRCRRHHGADSR